MSWSGAGEIQMTVGYVDFESDVEDDQKNQGLTMHPEVNARIFMSTRGFALLLRQVQATADRLEAEGVPVRTMLLDADHTNIESSF